jgi:hypothetical protein
MAISIPLTVGSDVKNTNGTVFKILVNDRPGSGPDVVAMDTSTGEIQYFYLDGVADNPLHANLVVSIPEKPTNPTAPDLVLTVNGMYMNRQGQRCKIVQKSSENKFKVTRPEVLFDFGYEVWDCGVKNEDSSESPDDLVAEWTDPFAAAYFVVADLAAPTDVAKWEPFTPTRPELSTVAEDKVLLRVTMNELVTNNQDYQATKI